MNISHQSRKERRWSKGQEVEPIIKPFILRRLKSQVATDLPEKVESIHFTDMTPDQEKRYEEVKNYYRDRIMEKIDKEGVGNSRFVLLEGLTKLRQLANHPRMVDANYHSDAGKWRPQSHAGECNIRRPQTLVSVSLWSIWIW